MIRNVLPLVSYYLWHYKGRSAILLVCLTVALALPLAMHRMVALLEREMVARADETPLVIGSRGSRFDLVLHALTFNTASAGVVRQAERFAIEDAGHAEVIPLFVRHHARGQRIVGTTAGYFSLRRLRVGEGRLPARLGDCVLGWNVAQALGLRPGDRLLSDIENIFDLGGARAIDLRVSGVLERSRSPDDRVVFVELETAWLIAGIGHGHDVPDSVAAESAVHTRVTAENLASFHFHGDPADFPLTALIVRPADERGRSLLLGRYVGGSATLQAVRPRAVVEELLGMLVQLRRFFDLHHAVLLSVTALLVALVMLLSLRLRRREIETLVHLGCSRRTIAVLQAVEIGIVLAIAAALAVAVSAGAVAVAGNGILALGA